LHRIRRNWRALQFLGGSGVRTDPTANRVRQSAFPEFVDAGKLCAGIAAQNPEDYAAIIQLGRIALLANRLDDAQMWLTSAARFAAAASSSPPARSIPRTGGAWPRGFPA
jgi:hypothetical protein